MEVQILPGDPRRLPPSHLPDWAELEQLDVDAEEAVSEACATYAAVDRPVLKTEFRQRIHS